MSYPQDPGQPQYPGQYGGQGQAPDNYLVWAILVTVLCCLPLGIVSIVKSTSVNNLWAQGDQAGAHAAAQSAKKFALWGAISGVVIGVLLVIGWIALIALAASSGSSTY